MKALRVSVVLLVVVLMQLTPSFAYAQVGEPTIGHGYGSNSVAAPGRYIELEVSIENTTDTPIVVSGTAITNVMDVSPDGLNHCPREWWGDAGYRDRPRGEDEQNPPSPAYPLPSITLAEPIVLEPGNGHTFDYMNLYMIQAAPNQCQRRTLRPVYEVYWAFQAPAQTYGTVAGMVTDSNGEPLTSGNVTITGTTDEGVVTENLVVESNGSYASVVSYLAGTELTVTASSEGYNAASSTVTVAEGQNTVNLALDPIPVPTGTVSGTAVDAETGNGIPNATVVLSGIDADGAQVSESLTSDESGRFVGTIQFQAGSNVSVSISAPGYVATTTSVNAVADGDNVIAPTLVAVQEEEPDTPETPDAEQEETPSPEASETPDAEQVETPSPGASETPDVEQGETPSPEASETATVEPEAEATETPILATPVTDPVSTSPVTNNQSAPTNPIVSTLPSTGSGSSTSLMLVVSSTLVATLVIAAGFRRWHIPAERSGNR